MRQKLITYKFLLMPTTHQKTIIRKSIDSARFIYNQLKSTKKVGWESYGVSFSKFDLQALVPSMKKNYPFLKVIHSQVAQDVNNRLKSAYNKFFKGGGYPKWARKGVYNSITYPQCCEIIKSGVLKLPQLKEIRFKDTRHLDDSTKIKQCTIKYDYITNQYFVSIVVERYFQELPKLDNKVGIDMGVAIFCQLSNGEYFDNPKYYQKSCVQLRILQRKLARAKKFGKNWSKLVTQLQKLLSKIANQRYDYLQKTSTTLINENQVIKIENLKIANMTKSAKGDMENHGKNVKQKSGLNRVLLNMGISSFFSMLEYKADLYGREVVKVSPAYTSQKCSCCGYIAKANRKTQAKFICEKCGLTINADLNAAINIREKDILSEPKRKALA